MRKLVLSVCVGLWVCGCDGAVDKSADEVEGREAGAANESMVDAARQPDDGEPQGSDDAARGETSDAAVARDDSGTRDGGAERDSGARDSGLRDAATGNDGAIAEAGTLVPDGGGTSGKPVFVIAGYRSGIAFSTDLGRTWKTVHGPTGPYQDNEYVLSGAAFGKGTFVVAGFDLFTSTDGEHWTERTHPGSWLGNMQFGLNRFVGTGGDGTSLWSDDGIAWHKGTMLGDNGYDTAAFGNGTFMTTSKEGVWWMSTNGEKWMPTPAGSYVQQNNPSIVFCTDHFSYAKDCGTLVPDGQTAFGAGVWIRAQHDTALQRSTNGRDWTDVNVGFEANAVAFGYIQ